MSNSCSDSVKADCIYKNQNEQIEVRVRDLLSKMTLNEKAGQMTQIERTVATHSAIKDLSIGSFLSGGGSGPFDKASPCEWADMSDAFQNSALQSRLGIPIIYATDAVHGHNNVFGATIFPHNIALGATRDADLVQRIGAATALEVRATGVHCAFAPCVAVARDPRWGRYYESFSEDTELVRNMTSVVAGLQGLPLAGHPNGYPYVAGRNNVIACAKHFVGDGGTDKGINEGNTILSLSDLEKIHMAPYLDCLSQGVSTVMATYSSWNGSKLHSDYYLLTTILKEKMGFQVMVPFRYEKFLEDLIFLVESGDIPISRIDDAVERILRVKFIAGLFEHPLTDRSLLDTMGSKIHRELAREAVRKSLVLLKNGKDPNKPFLPLDRSARRILVAGSHADDLGYQCGGWTMTWHGSSGNITTGTTILDAIKEAVGGETEVIYQKYPSPDIFAAKDFSFAVVVVVGEAAYAEALGDNSLLEIPFGGSDLISLVATRVPTLVIMISGRPLGLDPGMLEKVDAFVAAWLPGTEGAGIVDVVFGESEFVGLLPVTWFRRVDQLPLNAGDHSYDPLFPLGFGLKKFGVENHSIE
ncbi:hypothetical protein MKX03_014067 [Papaver bracteatum]|nr:hypothetical protein MKX03_014067 [Papaver bracteatum]